MEVFFLMDFGKRSVVFFILTLMLVGCAEDSMPTIQAVQTQQPAQSPELKRVPAYTKSVPPDEYDGFVYQGMLRKDLRDSGFGWPLIALSKAFGIPVVEMEKPKEYKDIVVPYGLNVGNKGEAVTLTLDTSHIEGLKYLISAEGAEASYIVLQKGHQVQMKSPPFTHHGGAINIQPLEMLQLLHISYAQEGQTIYIGQEEKSRIDGKILFDNKVMLGNDKETDVKLIYQYDPASKPNYEKVELTIDRESVILFDHDHKGSSDYYQNGLIEAISFKGDTLLKINLDEDVVILKRTSGHWERAFSPDQYSSFRQGNLSLLIDSEGTGTFIDSFLHLEHKVSAGGGSSNTTYPIDFMSFGHFEADEVQKELVITADLSARNEGRSIFNMKIRFMFDGTTFTPIHMASWDDAKYGSDKGSGKKIKSLDDYLQFSYSL
jgi:hypothetical protein